MRAVSSRAHRDIVGFASTRWRCQATTAVPSRPERRASPTRPPAPRGSTTPVASSSSPLRRQRLRRIAPPQNRSRCRRGRDLCAGSMRGSCHHEARRGRSFQAVEAFGQGIRHRLPSPGGMRQTRQPSRRSTACPGCRRCVAGSAGFLGDGWLRRPRAAGGSKTAAGPATASWSKPLASRPRGEDVGRDDRVPVEDRRGTERGDRARTLAVSRATTGRNDAEGEEVRDSPRARRCTRSSRAGRSGVEVDRRRRELAPQSRLGAHIADNPISRQVEREVLGAERGGGAPRAAAVAWSVPGASMPRSIRRMSASSIATARPRQGGWFGSIRRLSRGCVVGAAARWATSTAGLALATVRIWGARPPNRGDRRAKPRSTVVSRRRRGRLAPLTIARSSVTGEASRGHGTCPRWMPLWSQSSRQLGDRSLHRIHPPGGVRPYGTVRIKPRRPSCCMAGDRGCEPRGDRCG
jgi:hypothetical protein